MRNLVTGSRWRAAVPHGLAVFIALLLASFAFLFRFNALGGALGGFDNDEFQMLTRVDLLLAGEQPLRDFADGEMRGVWPSLSYEVPALVQRVWGRNLLVHAYLTLSVLALCAAIVFVFARHLSRSWLCALLATAVVMASGAKAYNYTKVVTLTVAVVAVYRFIRAPTVANLCVLAAWTVVAALFRHDYAVYVGVTVLVAIVAVEPRPWRIPLRRAATYAALGLLFALPSIVWVMLHGGIPAYVAVVFRSISAEGRRLARWPVVDLASPYSETSLVAFNYYVFWALPLIVAGVLMWQLSRGSRAHAGESNGPVSGRDGGESRAAAPEPHLTFGIVLVAMTLVVNYFFLRANLQARFGDGSVPIALAGAWLGGAASRSSSWMSRKIARAVPIVLLALVFLAFFRLNSLAHELETGGLSVSLEQTRLRFHEVTQTLRALPAPDPKITEGPLAASRYLSACTLPNDRVLMGVYADEIPYFARRLVAAGQGYFALGFLRSETDQRLALERLRHQSVPIVITAFDYEGEIARNYPIVARHISSRYREVGVITAAGRPYVRVFADIMRPPTSTDPMSGLPCFR
jgi:hypothetical protein